MCGTKCAVLICASIAQQGGSDEFWNDLVLMRCLLRASGFDKNNIFVLYGTGKDFSDPARTNPTYLPDDITDYPATRRNLELVLKGLAVGNIPGIPMMKEPDFLFVWTFGHGFWDQSRKRAKLALLTFDHDPYDQDKYEDCDFAVLIKNINCAHRVLVMGQCHSGGFIDDFEKVNDKTVVITSCAIDQIAKPADDVPPGEIETYWGAQYYHSEFNLYLYKGLCAGLTFEQTYKFIKSKDSQYQIESTQYYGGAGNIGANLTIKGAV